jgi:PKD repeat protein
MSESGVYDVKLTKINKKLKNKKMEPKSILINKTVSMKLTI